MRITRILAAVAVVNACTLTFLVGFGLGYDAGFHDDRMIAWPVILSPSDGRAVKLVADDSTTVLCIDNSPATTASGGILR